MLLLEKESGALNLFGAPQRLHKAIYVTIPCFFTLENATSHKEHEKIKSLASFNATLLTTSERDMQKGRKHFLL